MGLKQTVVRVLPDPLVDALRGVMHRARLEAERHGRLQRRINARIVVVDLPRVPRRPGSVWGVCLAKNEEDIIGHTVRHMLDQGAAGVIVLDNGSSDRTRQVLEAIAALDGRLHIGTDSEPAFHQGMKTSYLAHLAWRAGADWVVPFDADEYWFAPGATLAEYLPRVTPDRVWCEYRTVYPRAEDGLLDLDAGRPVQVDRVPTAWRKIAFRARRWAWVGEGNHDLRDRGPRPSSDLRMLHFSCRSLRQYSRKAHDGVAALEQAGKDASIATHWRGWATLGEDERNARWIAYLRGDAGQLVDGTDSADRIEIPDPTRWRTWDPEGAFSGQQ